MKDDIEKPEEKIYKKLLNDLTENAELKHKVDKDYRDLKLNIIRQRREFYQNIVMLSGIVIGLLASFGYKYIRNEIYFLVGIIIYLFLIVLIYNYFRESLDTEANSLQVQQDILDIFLEEYDKIIKNGISKLTSDLGNRKFNKEEFDKYYFQNLLDLGNSEIKKEMNMEQEKDNKEAWKRLEKRKKFDKSDYDYTGEFFLFVFYNICAFITLSLLTENYLRWYYLAAIIVGIMMVALTERTLPILRRVSKIIAITLGNNIPRKIKE